VYNINVIKRRKAMLYTHYGFKVQDGRIRMPEKKCKEEGRLDKSRLLARLQKEYGSTTTISYFYYGS
jgi:hypothetical protein